MILSSEINTIISNVCVYHIACRAVVYIMHILSFKAHITAIEPIVKYH